MEKKRRKSQEIFREQRGDSQGTARGQSGDSEGTVRRQSVDSEGTVGDSQGTVGGQSGDSWGTWRFVLHMTVQVLEDRRNISSWNIWASFVSTRGKSVCFCSLQLHCFVRQRLKVSRCSSVRPDVCSPPTVFLPPRRPVPLEQFLSLHSRCKHRYEH